MQHCLLLQPLPIFLKVKQTKAARALLITSRSSIATRPDFFTLMHAAERIQQVHPPNIPAGDF
jgi:hypothetical protein